MQDVPAISSERLHLVWLAPEVLEASLAGRTYEAAALMGARLPADWPEDHLRRVMQRRLLQIAEAPSDAPWLLRAMVRRGDQQVIGYINFHGPPNESGQAELGYTVFEAHRRRGYATEAVHSMIAWARREHRVRRFLLSISPENQPSLRLAEKLGFARIGEQVEDEDGLEFLF